MGLLDDAIREHLELKRRRGADPDEVARQEDEALGDPAQRRVRAAATPTPRRASRTPPSRRRAARARAGAGREPPAPRARARRPSRSPSPSRNRSPSRRVPAPARATSAVARGRRAPSSPPASRPPSSRRPTSSPAPRAPRAADVEPDDDRTRTCSRRRPTSSRRRRSTTGSGSSRSRRATSTSTTEAATARDGRPPLHAARRLHRRPACRATRSPSCTTPTASRTPSMHALRARDAAVGDLVRPGAGTRGRRLPQPHLDDDGRDPVRRAPVARRGGARSRARAASRASPTRRRPAPGCSRSTSRSPAARSHASMLQEPARRSGPELDPAEVLGAVGLDRGRRAPGAAVPGRLDRRSPRARAASATPRCSAAAAAGLRARSRACSRRTARSASTLAAVDPDDWPATRALVLRRRPSGRGPGHRLGRRPAAAPTSRQRAGTRRGSTIAQGVEMGRPSRLAARLEGDRVRVGGDARRRARRHRLPGRLIDPAPQRLHRGRACGRSDRSEQAASQERGRAATLASPSRRGLAGPRRRGTISCPGRPRRPGSAAAAPPGAGSRGDGGEGNRTPNSGMQGRRVPVSTTPPVRGRKGRGAATPAPEASCHRRRGKGGVAAVPGSAVVRPALKDGLDTLRPEPFEASRSR